MPVIATDEALLDKTTLSGVSVLITALCFTLIYTFSFLIDQNAEWISHACSSIARVSVKLRLHCFILGVSI